MKGFIVAACLLLCSQANASNWYYIAKGIGHDYFYIDASSVTTAGATKKKAWTLVVDKQSLTHMTLMGFDCANNETANLSQVSSNAQGEVLSSLTAKKPEYTPVVPDSVGETMFSILCHPKWMSFLRQVGTQTESPIEDAKLRRDPPPKPEPLPRPNASLQPPSAIKLTPTPAPSYEPPPIIEGDFESPYEYCKGNCAAGYQWARETSVNVKSACEGLGIEFARGCYYWIESAGEN